MRRIGPILAALCAALALHAGAARAADEALVLRMSAERLAAAGRCDEAIRDAKRARALAPGDAAAAAVEGRCELEQKHYEDAVKALDAAHRLAPNDAEVAIELLMAQYHLGDRVAAERTLTDAERLAPEDARVALYKGLLLLQRSQDRAAAEELERAQRLDHSTDPYASYYAGLAWQRANERAKAKESLERARERAAGGPWAEEADRALAQLGPISGPQTAWVRAIAGLGYDTNVLLKGDNVSQPNEVSGEKDGFGEWSLEAGAELFRTHEWAGGAVAGYQGNAYFDLNDFDLEYPSLSVWVDRRVDDRSFVRFQPYGGFVWTETDPYLGEVGGELAYYRGFDKAGSGRLYGRVGYYDYRFHIQGPIGNPDSNRPDRDGIEYLVGYEHALPVGETTSLRAGIAGGLYDSQGRDYDGYTAAIDGGVRQQLPFRFALDLSGGFSYEPYQHRSSYAFADEHASRVDRVWVAQGELERPITDWLLVTARYRYVNNDSNTAVFDYDRHIVGGYVTVLWNR
jgi:tetratricopeptide (TPR) repeat protein